MACKYQDGGNYEINCKYDWDLDWCALFCTKFSNASSKEEAGFVWDMDWKEETAFACDPTEDNYVGTRMS